MNVLIIGGGAAGFFAAITCAEENPTCSVTLLERSSQVLAKVRISGGGRCNVTHACFDPALLVTYYPRGGPALRGPFSRFQPKDTIAWFQARGVALKTEADGRLFPVTDQSQTVVDCLIEHSRRANVRLVRNALIKSVARRDGGGFRLAFASDRDTLESDRLILATGSNPQGFEWSRSLGHAVEAPVPSLFTFTIKNFLLEGLAGLSVPHVKITLDGSPLSQSGALLITHWGLSGPAVLKLSAWAARELHSLGYRARLRVNWVPQKSEETLLASLREQKSQHPKKAVTSENLFGFPRRLWARLASAAGVSIEGAKWADMSNERLRALVSVLQNSLLEMNGKSTFKEEFVTCGGVRLAEVNFKTMESKICPGLFFAGEILDIDGVTGGFNFQSAWTTGWLAGRAAAHAN